MHLFASARSAGKTLSTPYGDIVVELFSPEAAREMDVVLMAVSGDFSKEHAPTISAEGGALVIDNSSAWRMDEGTPLVVPEINREARGGPSRRFGHTNRRTAADDAPLTPTPCGFFWCLVEPQAIGTSRLIANPNCTTAIAVMALWPIHQQFKIKKLIISTYQASSGAGAEGMAELRKGTQQVPHSGCCCCCIHGTAMMLVCVAVAQRGGSRE